MNNGTVNTDQGRAPRFSIIMNVYNGEKFVAESIDSVLKQTFADWEMIIWDDCSADRTLEICRSYEDPRIQCFLAEERGQGGDARNFAIARAKGDWLAFIDQDDLWEPTKLAHQNNLIEQDTEGKLGLLYGRSMKFFADGSSYDFDRWHEFSSLPEGEIFDDLIKMPSFICLSSSVMLRSAVIDLGDIPGNIRFCHDYWLSTMICRKYQAAAVQNTCCWYRRHEHNMTRRSRIHIYREVLDIIESFGDQVDPKVLKMRRLIHESLIGQDEIIYEGKIAAGFKRIIQKGALLYLLYRPLLTVSRKIRRFLRITCKYKLIDALRAAHILKFVDWLKYWVHRGRVAPANLEFKRQNPEFPLPPHDLAFDAYNHVHWPTYKRVGRLHAEVFANVVKRHFAPGKLSIMEWGCGPGRLIRHFPALLGEYDLQLTGSDYNGRSIEWCGENLEGIRFVRNDLMPPLPFEDEQFEVLYCFSVFTHLSEEVQKAWAAEIKRVLKPGGLFICSTHGNEYRHLLTSKDDHRSYEAGDVVVKGKYMEGKKWYLAIHPEKFVKEDLLGDFDNVTRVEVGDDKKLVQDVWASRKPRD